MTEIFLPGEPESAPNTELLLPSTVKRIGRETIKSSGLISAGSEPDQFDVLHILDPVAARLLDQHNATRKSWNPRDVFPIDGDGKIARVPLGPDESCAISDDVLSAAIVGNATEENIPGYFHVIASNTDHENALATWGRQWAQEEWAHGYTFQAWFDLTEVVDSNLIHEIRHSTMNHGYTIEKSPLNMFAYTSFQEKATQVAHRQTGLISKNTYLNEIMKRIAKDEIHHMIFYREMAKEAFEVAPNQMMKAVYEEVKNFEMPGTGIPNFRQRSMQIANADIYNIPRHLDEVIMPILRYWNIFDREDLTGYGAQAREDLVAFLDVLRKQAASFTDQRESGRWGETIEKMKKRSGSNW